MVGSRGLVLVVGWTPLVWVGGRARPVSAGSMGLVWVESIIVWYAMR